MKPLSDRSRRLAKRAGSYVCLAKLAKLIAAPLAGEPQAMAAAAWRSRYEAYLAAGMSSAGAKIPKAR